MRPSTSKYACKVTLLIKKDIIRRFYGDYHPLNMQTQRDAYQCLSFKMFCPNSILPRMVFCTRLPNWILANANELKKCEKDCTDNEI
jgi:hypothetical protein